MIGPFDAVAAARAAGFGVAGIAHEQNFGRRIQDEKTDRAIKMGNGAGADAD